jgi:hypothetical protein
MRFALAEGYIVVEQGNKVLEKDEFFSDRCSVLKMTHGV